MKRFLFLFIIFTAVFVSSNFAQDERDPRANPWTDKTSFAFNIGSITEAMEIPLFETGFDFTIDSIKAVVSGTTPEINFNLRYGPSIVSGTVIFTSAQTANSETSGTLFTTFNASTPGLSDWVVLLITSVTGTVDNFSATVYITKN